jgi:hypothetical protein
VKNVILALLLLGCATTGSTTTKAGQSAQRVVSVGFVLRPQDLGPYHRIDDDPFGPVHFLVSDTRLLCIVKPDFWAATQPGDTVTCKWRRPR